MLAEQHSFCDQPVQIRNAMSCLVVMSNTHHGMPTKLLSSRNCLSCDSVHTRTVLSREAVMTPSGLVITPLTCASTQEVSADQLHVVCANSVQFSHLPRAHEAPRASADPQRLACLDDDCFANAEGQLRMQCTLCVRP